ncbi:MAG: phosphoribosyltransferase family protein [Candidatus Gracilibacteria bacterium]
MKYEFKSLKQILNLFDNNQMLGVTEISNILGLSRTIVHKYIKELVKQKKLKKIGKSPKTKYKSLKNDDYKELEGYQCKVDDDYLPDFKDKKILEEIFYKFATDGEKLLGFSGLQKWCKFRNLNIKEKTKNYISVFNHIISIQDNCGLLNATPIFGKHFEKVYLDGVYYADQYKWMEFGRGKLAEMTFYAKLSQDKKLILEGISEIILKLECVIKKGNFEAIAITPWSIDRKNQLLLFLKNELKFLGLPFVNIIKYYPNNIPIPQKSIKTRKGRIKNARNTIFVNDENIKKYSKVFLIDDFVGSGSTLNETAAKLKYEGVNEVYGFAFVGNMNLDYDVINEV